MTINELNALIARARIVAASANRDVAFIGARTVFILRCASVHLRKGHKSEARGAALAALDILQARRAKYGV